MAIQLTPELEALVQKHMATGNFESPEAVLFCALTSMPGPVDLNDPGYVEYLKRLVAEADEDIAAGRCQVLNAEELKRQVREHLKANGYGCT